MSKQKNVHDNVIVTKNRQTERQIKERCNEIFVPENIGAITYFLHNLIPYSDNRIRKTAFDTIVANSKVEGAKELVDRLVSEINK